MSDETEAIEDIAELTQVQRQARSVKVKAIVSAILLTIIALLLPQR